MKACSLKLEAVEDQEKRCWVGVLMVEKATPLVSNIVCMCKNVLQYTCAVKNNCFGEWKGEFVERRGVVEHLLADFSLLHF